jgi:hypothetical protein
LSLPTPPRWTGPCGSHPSAGVIVLEGAMRRAFSACMAGLLIAGCASLPRGDLPDGTYRASGGAPDALVLDGRRLSVYSPALMGSQRARPEARIFFYALDPDGSLRLWGSSNDPDYLRVVSGCDWRWSGSAIECRRKDGVVTNFARDTSGKALLPATPEQQVWLAAAERVLANESASVTRPRPLPIYHLTSFPRFRYAIAQLEMQARAGFCGLTREEAAGVVRSLHWQNKEAGGVGDVFDHRPGFAVVDRRPAQGDLLGLSRVVFDQAGTAAYLNVDIGGKSGSLVQFRQVNGAWVWAAECATWVTWR